MTAEKQEIREERERLGLDAPLSAPSPPSPTPPPLTTPLPAIATKSVTSLIPDPASYGDPSAWEHVRASPSPSPSPTPASATTTADTAAVSGTGVFDKASERLRELSSTVGNKIEQLAASHKDFQKQNTTPNQRTPVVTDAERDYYAAQDSEQQQLQREHDREYEATVI